MNSKWACQFPRQRCWPWPSFGACEAIATRIPSPSPRVPSPECCPMGFSPRSDLFVMRDLHKHTEDPRRACVEAVLFKLIHIQALAQHYKCCPRVFASIRRGKMFKSRGGMRRSASTRIQYLKLLQRHASSTEYSHATRVQIFTF